MGRHVVLLAGQWKQSGECHHDDNENGDWNPDFIGIYRRVGGSKISALACCSKHARQASRPSLVLSAKSLAQIHIRVELAPPIRRAIREISTQ